ETTATITVPIIPDAVDDDGETFVVTLSQPPTEIALVSPSQATVTIRDVPVRVGFDPTSYHVAEDGGDATLTVRLNRPATAAVTVHYQTSDGSAEVTWDYEEAAGDVTIPAGQMSATIAVPILPDDVPDDGEYFYVDLSQPSAGASLGAAEATV